MSKSAAKALGQKLVFALVILFSSLVLAVISLALQSWATQETDRYESRLGLIQRCHKLKIPLLDEECYSTFSVDCNDEDYISQAGLSKQVNCTNSKEALTLCLGLMVTALVMILAAVILCLPGWLRHTTLASVCGFVAGALFLSVVLIFRYVPEQDFAYMYFEGSACMGVSFGLAGGATLTAWCGSFVTAVVTWQQRSHSAKTAKKSEGSTTDGSWTREDDAAHSLSASDAKQAQQNVHTKTDGVMATRWQDIVPQSSRESIKFRRAESSL